MTAISTGDLSSELIDLSTVSLRELRTSARALGAATEWAINSSIENTNEIQGQDQ